MSSITASPNIQQVKPEQVQEYVDKFCNNVVEVVNGGLDFGNFNGKSMSVTFSSANVDTAVPHNLGRVVGSYLVLSCSAAMQIYNGTAQSTGAILYLRSSAAGTAQIIVF